MNRSILVISLLASITFLSLKCKDFGEPPLPEGSVRLSLDYASCTEVWLKLAFTDNNSPRGFALLRDGVMLTSGSLIKSDTLLIDTAVVAGHTYNYAAQRLNGSTAFDVSTLDVRTLDSTSHAINWIVDTLGAQGVIRDVWVFSRNNAWAVGEMYLLDSTGQVDMNHRYNVARWNGTKWQLLQVATESFGGSFGHADMYTIYAFDTGSVWTFSSAGSYCKWNGTSWESHYVSERSGGGMKLWGTSPTNLYLVGTNGSISRYNGSSWTQMTSNTTVDLQDIFGLDATHIWATGTNVSDGHSAIMQSDGKSWKTIYDNANEPPTLVYYFGTIWTDNSYFIYLDGSGLRTLRLDDFVFGKGIKTGLTYMVSCIRGTGENDIFAVSTGGEAVHFNGVSWFRYQDFHSFGGNGRWESMYATRDFIMIGGYLYTGLFGVPILARGYR